jgi:hypothetical protein
MTEYYSFGQINAACVMAFNIAQAESQISTGLSVFGHWYFLRL